VTNQANDSRQAQPMVDQALANLDDVGVTDNVKAFSPTFTDDLQNLVSPS
jgi:hypothetical protein